MQFGAAMFFTDYSMVRLTWRGRLRRVVQSVRAPEHSRIPRRGVPRTGAATCQQYYYVMDPFVSLSAAAAVTKTIRLGTGVCLIT
jgi:alkanesulfonate monooxygenase SsuD/methylene tetrahydromethanopterin reductase-like flavin-dependent oxidoreductase (luciferase family)